MKLLVKLLHVCAVFLSWRLQATAFNFTANYIGCPQKCDSNKGSGACVARVSGGGGWCVCFPGFGGPGCNISAATLFGVPDPYAPIIQGLATAGSSAMGSQAAPSGSSGLAPVLDAVFGGGSGGSGAGDQGPQLVVQVGCGRQAALEWGVRLRERGGGLLLCVDYFLVAWADRVMAGAAGASGGTAAAGQQQQALGADLLAAPLRQLLAAVQAAGLRQWVLPLPGHPRDVLRALTALGAAPDVISLGAVEGAGAGGNREALERWLALLPAGGVLVLAHANSSTAADVSSFAAAAGAAVVTLASHSLVVKGGGGGAGTTAGAAVQQPAGGAAAAGVESCDPAGAVPPAGWAPCGMKFIQVDMAGRAVSAAFVSQGPWGNLLSPYYMVRTCQGGGGVGYVPGVHSCARDEPIVCLLLQQRGRLRGSCV